MYISHKNVRLKPPFPSADLDDYRSHTSCMTESERYEGKFAKSKKKRNPQEEWMDVVASCCGVSAPSHLQGYLQIMATLENIPRKEKQFRNFTSNSLRLHGRDNRVVSEIWDILKAERERRSALISQEQETKVAQIQQNKVEIQEPALSPELRPADDTCSTAPKAEHLDAPRNETERSGSELDAQKVRKAAKKVLKKAPNRCMKVKTLRKVLLEQLGLSKSAKKRLKSLVRDIPLKTTSSTRIQIEGKTITLLS